MKKEVNARRNKLLIPLHDSYIEAQAEVHEVESSKPQPVNTQANQKLAHAILEIKSLPKRIKDSFAKLKKQAALKYQDYTSFKFHRSGDTNPTGEINRVGATPIVENAIFLLMLCH